MELQELIERGRFIFSRAPDRLNIYNLVNGRNSAKEIAKKLRKTHANTLRDLQKIRDVGLIEPKIDKTGSLVKTDGSLTYQKVPLAKQISPRYFSQPISRRNKLGQLSPAQRKVGISRIKQLPIPAETDILDIWRGGETQNYEFKGPGVEMKKISREVAAFLHTRTGGIVFYGVEDDGTIAGVDMRFQEFDQSLQNSLRNTIFPAPTVLLKSKNVLGTELFVVIVPPWNRREIYYFEDKVHIRKGTNVFVAKPHEIRKLHKGLYIV